ncbi:MAG: PrsW family intramembrane metalloprotease [Acidimicrobiia bacterium]
MMEVCRVCERPGTHRLGSYAFCDTHYERARRGRGSLWGADLVSVLVLVALVVVMGVLDPLLEGALGPTALFWVGLALAVIASAVWLAFFYRRDRLEPEPKGMVLQVFVLAALLAAAVGNPVADNVYRVSDWLYRTNWAQILGGVLVLGFSQEFLKYAAVRFSVYSSAEFDERTDGIIYGTAAGLGYALVLNVALVLDSGGVDLGAGSIRIVLTALAHASFAGITGYFLGRQKLEARPLWWMPLGVSVAAVLNGLFFYLRGAVAQGGIGPAGGVANPWAGLALAGALAVLVAWGLSALIRRDLAAAEAS